MTVQELTKALQGCDPNSAVMINVGYVWSHIFQFSGPHSNNDNDNVIILDIEPEDMIHA